MEAARLGQRPSRWASRIKLRRTHKVKGSLWDTFAAWFPPVGSFATVINVHATVPFLPLQLQGDMITWWWICCLFKNSWQRQFDTSAGYNNDFHLISSNSQNIKSAFLKATRWTEIRYKWYHQRQRLKRNKHQIFVLCKWSVIFSSTWQAATLESKSRLLTSCYTLTEIIWSQDCFHQCCFLTDTFRHWSVDNIRRRMFTHAVLLLWHENQLSVPKVTHAAQVI